MLSSCFFVVVVVALLLLLLLLWLHCSKQEQLLVHMQTPSTLPCWWWTVWVTLEYKGAPGKFQPYCVRTCNNETDHTKFYNAIYSLYLNFDSSMSLGSKSSPFECWDERRSEERTMSFCSLFFISKLEHCCLLKPTLFWLWIGKKKFLTVPRYSQIILNSDLISQWYK